MRASRSQCRLRVSPCDCQMMRNSVALGPGDFSSCDVDSAIDLNRIEVDDLAVAGQSQLDAKLAFARSGGPYDYRNQSSFTFDDHETMLAIA